jgi:hypothetical protein
MPLTGLTVDEIPRNMDGCCFMLGMGLMAVEAFISRVGGSWISGGAHRTPW